MRSGWLVWKKSGRNIMDGKTLLNKDFREFIQSLNDNNVQISGSAPKSVITRFYQRNKR